MEDLLADQPELISNFDVFISIGRAYAVARMVPQNFDSLFLDTGRYKNSDAIAWFALAYERTGNLQKAMEILNSAAPKRTLFFHTIRCSIAAHVGGGEVAGSLRGFFEEHIYEEDQIVEAIVRLCITKAWMNGVLAGDSENRIRHLVQSQVKLRNPKALLSDYVRNGEHPWLDLIKAFANYLQNSVRDFEDLIEDRSVVKIEQDAIDFARNWKSQL